jgi:hypothetical protein
VLDILMALFAETVQKQLIKLDCADFSRYNKAK